MSENYLRRFNKSKIGFTSRDLKKILSLIVDHHIHGGHLWGFFRISTFNEGNGFGPVREGKKEWWVGKLFINIVLTLHRSSNKVYKHKRKDLKDTVGEISRSPFVYRNSSSVKLYKQKLKILSEIS